MLTPFVVVEEVVEDDDDEVRSSSLEQLVNKVAVTAKPKKALLRTLIGNVFFS